MWNPLSHLPLGQGVLAPFTPPAATPTPTPTPAQTNPGTQGPGVGGGWGGGFNWAPGQGADALRALIQQRLAGQLPSVFPNFTNPQGVLSDMQNLSGRMADPGAYRTAMQSWMQTSPTAGMDPREWFQTRPSRSSF